MFQKTMPIMKDTKLRDLSKLVYILFNTKELLKLWSVYMITTGLRKPSEHLLLKSCSRYFVLYRFYSEIINNVQCNYVAVVWILEIHKLEQTYSRVQYNLIMNTIWHQLKRKWIQKPRLLEQLAASICNISCLKYKYLYSIHKSLSSSFETTTSFIRIRESP